MSLKFLSNQTTDNKIGIGTNVPDAELDVRSASRTAPVVLKLGNGIISGDNGVIVSQIRSYINNSNTAADELARIQVENGSGSHDDGNLSFWTRDGLNNVDAAKQLQINGKGVVELKKSGTAALPVLVLGEDVDTGFFRPSSNNIALSTTGVERVRVTSGGNVGIGTVSPGATLHVKNTVGSYPFIVETPYDRVGKLISTDAGAELIIQDSGSTDNGNSISVSGDTMTLRTANSNRIRILANGNVGINTTSPDFKLDVDGTFGVSDLPFNTDSVSVLVADETIGAETITNGDFATDSDWTKSSNVSISGGQATFTANSAAQYIIQGSLWPANSLSGQKVKLTYTIVSNSLNGGNFRIGGYTGASAFTLNGLVTTVGTHNIILDVRTTAGDDNAIDLYITSAATSGALVIDNVSVKQITSASNQIQKRELGTGAFGPTPVGAYLPLSAGSGFPLTGDLYLDTPAGASQSGYALKLKKTSSSSVVQVGAEIFATPWASNTNGGTIIFKNADTATNLQETLRISANGSVGINSTSSSYKLDVGGNARFQDSVYIDTSTGSGGLYVTRLGSPVESLKIYTSDSTSVFETFQDENTGVYGSMAFILDNGAPDPDFTFKYGSIVRLKIEGGTGDVILGDALLSNQENTDIDSAAAEVVAQVSTTDYTAAFFDFVVKKTTNVRSGTVYACHDGTSVVFTETSTNDLGDTSDVTLSVDISGTNMRLLATVTSDDWSVKSLIRAI